MAKLLASNARIVVLRKNAEASTDALELITDRVWSSGFWTVMESVNLSLETFIHLLSTGRSVEILMTVEQTEKLLKFQREAFIKKGMPQLFTCLRPEYVTTSRVNFCENCNKYHEKAYVFEVVAQDDREGALVRDWDNGNDYSIACMNCGTILRQHGCVVYAGSHQRNHQNGCEPYACDTTVAEYLPLWLEWYDEHHRHEHVVSYVQDQLNLSELAFLQPMTKEEYEKIPK